MFSRCAFALLLALVAAFGQANHKLQIHFMDVGQGDGALLISPAGKIVLFDGGNAKDCEKPVTYLGQLGITTIDYMVISHYHADHFGCTTPILNQSPLQVQAFDRGGSYNSQDYVEYVKAVGNKRKQAATGQVISLDEDSDNPVKITFIAEDGNGIATTNENDLSLVAVVEYGGFRAEIGGDLSGYADNSYKDIETGVAPHVGEIDIYKVHHHCSAYSTNDVWLSTTKPTIGIVSSGVQNNDYGHPTAECLERLHNAGVKAYWTELGKGAPPDPAFDIIAGNIVVETDAGQSPQIFTVKYNEGSASYPVKNGHAPSGVPAVGPVTPPSATPPSSATPKFAWSRGSTVYHLFNCRFVSSIKPENLVRGDDQPGGKTLHKDCPQ